MPFETDPETDPETSPETNPETNPETLAATHGIGRDRDARAIAPPLYLSSTFAFDGFERPGPHEYSRTSNPSRDLLAEALARLEGGAGAVVTASGMAAIDLVLALVRPGELVVAPHDCYGGTFRLLTARAGRGHFDLALVDQGDAAALAAALARGPKLVLVETPSNPLMRVRDIGAIADRAHGAGAKVVADNTFLSPALQRPIALGADFVVHSTTKFINGHSDVVGGVAVAATAADAAALADWANVAGTGGAPFDAWLTLRGLRTLFPRIRAQQAHALAVARFLAGRPEVRAVNYPGLEDDPGHALAAAQQQGFGAMLSFELADGAGGGAGGGPGSGTDAVRAFVEALRVFTLAESLGGVESLVAHPATMTHAAMGPEARRAAGISDTLLRLSVGLEAEDDLLADLDRALAAGVR